jgi:hypothetical protein
VSQDVNATVQIITTIGTTILNNRFVFSFIEFAMTYLALKLPLTISEPSYISNISELPARSKNLAQNQTLKKK